MTTESFPVKSLIKNNDVIFKGSEIAVYDFINENLNINVDAAINSGYKIEWYIMYKTKEEIQKWCDEYLIIEKYFINDDLTVDVYGNVYLAARNLATIPIQFNIVEGHFNCHYNSLISLEGSPKIVYGDFNCSHNYCIKSLKYCPKLICGDFICNDGLMNENEYKLYLIMKSLRK